MSKKNQITGSFNIIFLDIDGVLNNEVFVSSFYAIAEYMELQQHDIKPLYKKVMRDEYGIKFCPTATNMLKWVIESTGAKIVVSSTWRKSGLKVMQEMWKKRNLPGEVIDVTPVLDSRHRGEEIEQWIENFKATEQQEFNYVIFDDDNDMLPHQNFVQTDFRYGLTFNDAVKAVKLLNVNCL